MTLAQHLSHHAVLRWASQYKMTLKSAMFLLHLHAAREKARKAKPHQTLLAREPPANEAAEGEADLILPQELIFVNW